MSQLPEQKRKKCDRCFAPLSRCLCQFTPSDLHSPVPVIILQHKDERDHYLNTAKILSLSCDNVFLFTGENFHWDEIIQSLNLAEIHWYLFFPHEKAITIEEFTKTTKGLSTGLIILDGTWKKAKKIFYTNSFLQQIPIVKLTNFYPSTYELRVCHKENHLSTLEAFAYFLEEVSEKKLGEELRARKKMMIERQKKFLQGIGPGEK